ncbi:MAG: hypothetical protein K6E19_07550 [Lachnospiraceae bacterium]|nr:hypothetical protein [Lachnospiraceae bacterium]
MSDPFNLKLFLLRIFREFKVLIAGTLIGAIVIGCGYLLGKLVLTPTTYQMRIVFHENLHYDDFTGQYTYVNGYTWNEMSSMDMIAGTIAAKLGGDYTKESVASMLSTSMESDTRVIYFYITDADKEKIKDVESVSVETLCKFVSFLPEIEDITILDQTPEPYRVNNVKYWKNAFMLGAITGLVVSFFILCLYILADDSVYIPELFERKYGAEMQEFDGEVPEGALFAGRTLPGDETLPSSGETELYILSGAHNGKIVDHILFELGKREVKVTKAYLVKPAKWIIKGYYAGTKWPHPFMK